MVVVVSKIGLGVRVLGHVTLIKLSINTCLRTSALIAT